MGACASIVVVYFEARVVFDSNCTVVSPSALFGDLFADLVLHGDGERSREREVERERSRERSRDRDRDRDRERETHTHTEKAHTHTLTHTRARTTLVPQDF